MQGMQFQSAEDFQFFPRHWKKRTDSNVRNSFTLLTYNILADVAMEPIKGYDKYVPIERRYMDYRLPRILKELKEMDADVVCLQEVQACIYTNHLQSFMKTNGYEGVFLQRQDDLGEATFFKSSKFECVDSRCCVLHEIADDILQKVEMDKELRDHIRRHICKPNAILLTKLKLLDNKKEVAIGNVHALWSTTQLDIVLLQVACAVKTLSSFAGGPEKSQILTGDFNSTPDSAVYHLLSGGEIDKTWREQLQKHSEKISATNGGQVQDMYLMDLIENALGHEVPLKSAYAFVLGKEPPITNHDGAYFDEVLKVCFDYIWFHSDRIDVTAVLDMPPEDALSRHYSLPSPLFPSDHLPVKAELLLK
ncbi:2',5'-phosphodiesterase 12 [Lingula anatina]|uniref:2',5'-phosphodiesterase 12 n=1 Tax=Lingula anatina TaxID=7574 RepID=A0A1S3J8R4_LINAN|nr:2',5'-phosphodiesterase 12 [Lingula anatina]|eukprot:XP_013406259.1 2',5'-phosphodiesterase 12 [Lingula anatina]